MQKVNENPAGLNEDIEVNVQQSLEDLCSQKHNKQLSVIYSEEENENFSSIENGERIFKLKSPKHLKDYSFNSEDDLALKTKIVGSLESNIDSVKEETEELIS